MYGRFIEFKNPGINDSLIEKKFLIDKPMFLGTGNLIMTPGDEGNVVDDDFLRPSNSGFEQRLAYFLTR